MSETIKLMWQNKIGGKTLTLSLQLNVESKGPWSQKNVFGCKTNFHKWGRVQEMEPIAF
jgi:hypothetical protein